MQRRVSGSHASPLAIKTDAPSHVIWDILRCWIKDHPLSESTLSKQSEEVVRSTTENDMAAYAQLLSYELVPVCSS